MHTSRINKRRINNLSGDSDPTLVTAARTGVSNSPGNARATYTNHTATHYTPSDTVDMLRFAATVASECRECSDKEQSREKGAGASETGASGGAG